MTEQAETAKVWGELREDYVFRVSFQGTKTILIMDEPPPLGNLLGPNASRVLSAAVANCLSASLAFCLRKSKVNLKGIRTEAEPITERNKDGYLRVTKIKVTIRPELVTSEDQNKLRRCVEIFEKYCTVTGAVKSGVQVDVEVDTGPTPTE